MSEFSQKAYKEDIFMEVFDHLKRRDIVEDGRLSGGEFDDAWVEDICLEVIGRARGTIVFYLSADEIRQVLEWSENIPDSFEGDVSSVDDVNEIESVVYEVVYEDAVSFLRDEVYLAEDSYLFTEKAFEEMVFREEFERTTEPMV